MANRRHDVICHTTLGTSLVPTRRDGIGVGCTAHTHTHTHTHTLARCCGFYNDEDL